MKILHSEASPGWGGQERRILIEALGMRERGHEIIFAVIEGGLLVQKAREHGFRVYEIPFSKKNALRALFSFVSIIKKHRIDIVNTHSSLDAWIAAVAAKLCFKKVIRTRHLSTAVRKGFNSIVLYNFLADIVVTTCESTKEMIKSQARLPPQRIFSIPTGIDPKMIQVNFEEVARFRESLGIQKQDCLVGTLCVLRGWKGISDLLHAAKILEDEPHLKWIIVGGGVSEEHFRNEWRSLKLEKTVIFTGHLDTPYTALAAMEIFLLLSYANEGVSQASLQAGWLKKPLITTAVGGLGEVCLPGVTGYLVEPHSPSQVAQSVLTLKQSSAERKRMGECAHNLVKSRFTLDKMLDAMEALY